MNQFDRAMTHLDKAFGFMSAPHQYISRKDEADKMIVCERGDLVFVFNFHPTNSYTDYRIGCQNSDSYKVWRGDRKLLHQCTAAVVEDLKLPAHEMKNARITVLRF